MIRWLDFRIFGNGYGLAAPYFDQPFYWLSGRFYTFMGGFGAQLHSFQWTHPRAGEIRDICGVRFRPFNSSRRWGRVRVAWCANLPSGINEANEWLRQFKAHLSSPLFPFEFRPAQGIEARSDETPQAVQPEGQEPGPKDALKASGKTPNQQSGRG